MLDPGHHYYHCLPEFGLGFVVFGGVCVCVFPVIPVIFLSNSMISMGWFFLHGKKKYF